MNLLIKKAVKADMSKVLDLIKELAQFENALNQVEITVKNLEDNGFEKQKQFVCFVAKLDSDIVGMALVYKRYSTWKGVVLHLEDLIVTKTMRGKGIGTKLLNAVVAYGKTIHVKRISWEVLDWNTNAIAFYNKKGAHVLKEWRVVQLNQEAITNYR